MAELLTPSAQKDGQDESAIDLKSNSVDAAAIKDLKPEPAIGVGQELNLDMIADIPVTISVEIGRIKVPIKELLHYRPGTVVELDRLADEPLNVFVNSTLVAHGKIVVTNDRFGIRLTDVLGPADKLKNHC